MGRSIADAVSPDALVHATAPRARGQLRRDVLHDALLPYFILTSSKTRCATQMRI